MQTLWVGVVGGGGVVEGGNGGRGGLEGEGNHFTTRCRFRNQVGRAVRSICNFLHYASDKFRKQETKN